MAGRLAIFHTAEIALAAATVKTIGQLLAATNIPLEITGWGIFFDGVSTVGEPVQVRLLKQSTAIGGTPTANNPIKVKGPGTLQATGFIYGGAPTEPTAGIVLDIVEAHPQAGYEVKYPQDQYLELDGAERLGIEATAPAIVNARIKIWFRE